MAPFEFCAIDDAMAMAATSPAFKIDFAFEFDDDELQELILFIWSFGKSGNSGVLKIISLSLNLTLFSYEAAEPDELPDELLEPGLPVAFIRVLISGLWSLKSSRQVVLILSLRCNSS